MGKANPIRSEDIGQHLSGLRTWLTSTYVDRGVVDDQWKDIPTRFSERAQGLRMMQDHIDAGKIRKIGREILERVEHKAGKFFLYIEVEEEFLAPNLYEDLGEEFLWRNSKPSFHSILDFWYESPKGKRWDAMEYVIENGRFAAYFLYPGEVDKTDQDFREKRLVARMGDKPIRYPDENFDDWTIGSIV